MPATGSASTILSAPRFYVQPVGGGSTKWSFSEMTNITAEVEPSQFLYCDPDGSIVHTKQYGMVKPPTVVLKKPMDLDRTLWMWHYSCQCGNPEARMDCTLNVFPAGSPGHKPDGKPIWQFTMGLAWPSKMEVSGMKAGSTDTGTLTVTFSCDYIEVAQARGKDTGAPFAA